MRSASARAAATASSRSRRARRRSSSATRCGLGGPLLGGPGPVQRLARGEVGGADRGQRLLERLLALAQARAGVADDRGGQPEPLGDREGLAAARQADPEVIGRRERLEVELDGRVPDVGGRVGVDLQLGVVGRRGHQGAGAQEVVEQGLGQGRALRRVGPRPELVEQDERRGAGGRRDPHDRAQVAGEGGEALGDALLVPDVGEQVAPGRAGGCPDRRERGARPGASGRGGRSSAASRSSRRCSGRSR